MARLARVRAAGYPHHVIQRGVERRAVFVDDDDRRRYLAWLGRLAREHAVAIHAYVLMDNHVHLLGTPVRDDGFSRLMQSLSRLYVRWFNDRYGRSGALWEGRFRASVIDADQYLLACSRYIELNPVRAGLVADPAEYPWSSYRHHVGLGVDLLVSDHLLVWSLGNTPFDRQAAYRALFERALPPAQLDSLRKSIQRGRPLGSLTAAPRPRGRPRKRGSD